VDLPLDCKYRYPHEFSGGQRQRIVIARALAVNPKVLICDEPTSALDVHNQEQIVQLLLRLQKELGLSYLFITHNIPLAASIAHEIAVMRHGKIIEYAATEQVINNPQQEYTKELLRAAGVK
jgi:ABC-type oligopeptide transport system ATPase subunit